jgi:hypothetical protein
MLGLGVFCIGIYLLRKWKTAQVGEHLSGNFI